MKTVAEQIADYLVAQGITQVFCVTGGGAMFLNYSLASHPDIVCTFMHHEQACAMAAEGYARITGRPAVVLVTTGPGAINAMNGVYGAYTDSIPMLVLSGQVKRETCRDFYTGLSQLRQLGDQEGPIVDMVKPITKSAVLVREPLDLEQLLPNSIRFCQFARPGPCWIDIPIDVQSSKQQLNFQKIDTTPCAIFVRSNEELEFVKNRLLNSKRPLILAGTGVRLSGAIDHLHKFAEIHNIPIATAWTHDLIASDHRLFAGRPGTIGTRGGNFNLQAADLVLIIGSRSNIRQTGFNWNDFARNAFTIQIDIDHTELQKPIFSADHKILADAAEFLKQINNYILPGQLPDYRPWANWTRSINDRYQVVDEHSHKSHDCLNPYLVVNEIFKHLKQDDIIVSGNASACIIPGQVGRLTKQQRMFSNSGSASMGYDLPAALGAASAESGRVICFAGDGSIHMNIQELQTLASGHFNVIVIVLNNHGYLSIKQTHENFFGRVVGATPATGIEFPEYTELAKVYNIPSIKLRNTEDLTRLGELLSVQGPFLIDIDLDPDQGFAPRMKSRLDVDGNFVPLQLDDMFPFLAPEEVDTVRQQALLI